MWDPRWVGSLWGYHAGVFQHQLPILCGHQLGVLQVSWILTWTTGKLAPTWQVKASVPLQMPVTSRGSPGYPHFCVTWLHIGGVHDPLLRCDGVLWNAEMIRLIMVEPLPSYAPGTMEYPFATALCFTFSCWPDFLTELRCFIYCINNHFLQCNISDSFFYSDAAAVLWGRQQSSLLLYSVRNRFSRLCDPQAQDYTVSKWLNWDLKQNIFCF